MQPLITFAPESLAEVLRDRTEKVIPRKKRALTLLKSMRDGDLYGSLPSIEQYLADNPDDDLAWSVKVMMQRRLGLLEEASHTAAESISHFTGLDIEELTARISELLPPSVRIVRTSIMPPAANGTEHLGFLFHEVRIQGQPGAAITKIVRQHHVGNEYDFYQQIRNLCPDFLASIPAIYGLLTLPDQACFCITMEWIDGKPITLEQMSDAEIISLLQAHAPLSQVCPDASEHFRPTGFNLRLGMKNLSPLLGHIHSPSHLERLSFWLVEVVRNRSYHPALVARMSKVLMEVATSRMASAVVPNQHYRLNHGDFYHGNVISPAAHAFKFIDWNAAVFSAKGLDLAQLLRRLPYDRIRFLLSESGITNAYDPIDWFFFNYALIAASVMIDIPQIVSEDPDKLFLPALKEIERLI